MIYCVEDDKGIRELVVYTLLNTGFEASGFESGKELYAAIKTAKPELILLDIMLPCEDGIQILKHLKADMSSKDIPVIMLTAKGSEYDKVIGLDTGADDYITKPFGMMELISRIKALLRRIKNEENESGYSVGNVKMDLTAHTVLVSGENVELTLKEFELLRFLMKNRGKVLTRDRLLESIWGYDFDGETRTVDVHIRSLRAKLGENGNIIETVRGVGYRAGNKR